MIVARGARSGLTPTLLPLIRRPFPLLCSGLGIIGTMYRGWTGGRIEILLEATLLLGATQTLLAGHGARISDEERDWMLRDGFEDCTSLFLSVRRV